MANQTRLFRLFGPGDKRLV